MKKLLTIILCVCVFPIISGCESKNFTTKYNMDLVFTDNELYGQMQVEFVLQQDGFADFNLFASAYRQNATFFAVETQYLPIKKEYGDIKILSVNSNCFVSYELLQDNSLLRVHLKAKKGQKVNVFIEYNVTLSNFSHRLGIGEQTVNLGNFYPILAVYENGYVFCPYYNIGDPFYSQVANYVVSLVCDGDYVVASSGFCDSVQYLNGQTKYVYSLNNARDFAFSLSKQYKVLKGNFNNTDIYYYYLNGTVEQEMQLIIDALAYFNKFYPYPYKTYSVCQNDFCYGGMEYPCLVYINKNLTDQDKLLTIVHETAHQWWYGIVGNNQITNACLDEGLTEFSTIIFFEDNEKYNIYSKNLITQKIIDYSNFTKSFKVKYGLEESLAPTRSLSEYKNAIDYTFIAYYYMPYCFYQMYSKNKTEFILALTRFAKDFAYREATLNSLKNYFSGAVKIYYQSILLGKGVLG